MLGLGWDVCGFSRLTHSLAAAAAYSLVFAISNGWTVVCFLLGCACCEMMVFGVVGLFCCGGINSNGFDVGFVTFDWLTVYVRFMCEECFIIG